MPRTLFVTGVVPALVVGAAISLLIARRIRPRPVLTDASTGRGRRGLQPPFAGTLAPPDDPGPLLPGGSAGRLTQLGAGAEVNDIACDPAWRRAALTTTLTIAVAAVWCR